MHLAYMHTCTCTLTSRRMSAPAVPYILDDFSKEAQTGPNSPWVGDPDFERGKVAPVWENIYKVVHDNGGQANDLARAVHEGEQACWQLTLCGMFGGFKQWVLEE